LREERNCGAVQRASEVVAAALLKRMKGMSKMHVASVLVSLLFGATCMPSDRNPEETRHGEDQPSAKATSEAPCKETIPQNLQILVEVVMRMLSVLQQIGLVDHAVPCSLVNVLLNPEVSHEQEQAAVSVLSILNCNKDTAGSVAATLRHASTLGLEHLQQSTIKALATICSTHATGKRRDISTSPFLLWLLYSAVHYSPVCMCAGGVGGAQGIRAGEEGKWVTG
jgi:hypothetical protein